MLKPISCTPGHHYRDFSDMNSAKIIELFLTILNILEKSVIFLPMFHMWFLQTSKALFREKSRILTIELLCKISGSNRDLGSGIQIFFSPATILLSLPCQYSGGVLCAIKSRPQPSLFLQITAQVISHPLGISDTARAYQSPSKSRKII